MNQGVVDWESIRQRFQETWGYRDFRSPQGEVIRTLLDSKDAFIVMPTGSGKSICFQLPALFGQGLTLVISPLVALMENQVRELQQRQLPAGLLHNELSKEERRQVLNALSKEVLSLLYLSPETLLSTPVWEKLTHPNLKINGIILDEAHCLVQWGEVFRPEYRRLGAVRPALLQSKPPGTKIAIAAFTATADLNSQRLIQRVLKLENPAIFRISPYRSNLTITVKIAWTSRCRRDQLLKFIQERKAQSGLIYVRSRKKSEELAFWLKSLGYSTAAYHGGLSSEERRYLEASWLEGKLQSVVCTSAFGLGINKPDVRWIAHFHSPLLLAEYLQEIGRGGRDGQKTDTLMIVSEPTGWMDPEDKQLRQFFINQLSRQYQKAQQFSSQLPPKGNIQSLSQELPQTEIALSLLHSADKLEWLDPFHYRIYSGNLTHSLAQLQEKQKQVYQSMVDYLNTRNCRWQFLLNAFGFNEEASGFNCGHCDNCRLK